MAVAREPRLRRLQLGWACFFLVDGIALVALSVWAFREGGARAVGFVGLARLLPGALALPFGAWTADRFSRRVVVTVVFAAMAAVHALLALALAADAPNVLVYALVALASVTAAPYRPAQLALVPLVARSPDELVACNVAAGTVEGVVTFLGPVVAATLLTAAGTPSVVAAAAVAAGLGLIAVAGIRVDVDPSRAVRSTPVRPVQALLGGFAVIGADRDLTVIIVCFVAQLFVRGVLMVLLVAVSFDSLGLGRSGVGWLTAAMGVGGVVGGVYALTLTARRRLALPMAASLVLWGAPIAIIGLLPETPVVVICLAVIGIGNATLDVSGLTLVQRLGADRTLGRVFGVLYTVGIAMGGLGSLAAPALVSATDLRLVLVGTGVVLPLLTLALLPRFRSIDARAEAPPELLDVVAKIPVFAPLPATSVEKLATRCVVHHVPAGEVIVAEGDVADAFFAVVDGELQVTVGHIDRRRLGPGDHFGEIALLRGGTRTATVTAVTDARVASIGTQLFLDAVTSSTLASSRAWQATERLLADDATNSGP